jgi:hypothetical protein
MLKKYKLMFHHSKKLCYVVFPKSGSTSMRSWLQGRGFTKPLGENGHFKVTEILDYAEKTNLDLSDYTFFSTYIDREHHFRSHYKHIMKKWGGHPHAFRRDIPKLKGSEEFLKTWNIENRMKVWFHDLKDKLRLNLFLHLDNVNLERFCKKYSLKFDLLPHKNSISMEIPLSLEESKKLEEIYEYYEEIKEKCKFN